MLKCTSGCELPCWWGITPGQSSWQEAQSLPGHQFLLYPDEESEYIVNLAFRKQGEVVDGIVVTGRVQGSAPATFARDWDAYSLDHVLDHYGIPSAGYLALVEDKPGYAFYLLLLHYQDRGFAIRYYHSQALGGDFEKLGTMYKTCFPLRDVTLWLQSPESNVPLDIYMDELTWPSVLKIEDATGMTLEEFYDTFRYPGACLEIPPTG